MMQNFGLLRASAEKPGARPFAAAIRTNPAGRDVGIAGMRDALADAMGSFFVLTGKWMNGKRIGSSGSHRKVITLGNSLIPFGLYHK